MPHINVIFVEDEAIKQLLRVHKRVIRVIVARCTGYSLDAIALIPHMVPKSIADLADNLLPLEFSIDAGTKCAGKEKETAEGIERKLRIDISDIRAINFGIWLRTMTNNHFIEYKPSQHSPR